MIGQLTDDNWERKLGSVLDLGRGIPFSLALEFTKLSNHWVLHQLS